MKMNFIPLAGFCLIAAAAKAEVRVYVQDTGGVAWLKYECTAGEVVRAFALDVSVDRGQITGISDFFVGPCSAAARGYGIFPAAFRDRIMVSSGTSANWSVSGYNPLAVVADAPTDTLAGLNTSGVTLEFGALWDPALPTAAPAPSGTLCALQLSAGANVSVAANASRGGVVASADGNQLTPTFAGAAVGLAPEMAIALPDGSNLDNGGAKDFGVIAVGSNTPISFIINNTGTAALTGLEVTKDGANPDDFTVTASPLAPVSGPNGTTTLTVQFAPAAAGARQAVIHIANNDSDENPFNITLTGTGSTDFQGWTSAAGLPSTMAGPMQSPQGDGVPNLLKFAFNMDPTKPDARELSVGSNATAGLPGGALLDGALRIEFLRRKALTHPGITYTPQFGSEPNNFVDFAGAPATVTSVDSIWERVVVADPDAMGAKRFARVKIILLP